MNKKISCGEENQNMKVNAQRQIIKQKGSMDIEKEGKKVMKKNHNNFHNIKDVNMLYNLDV